MTLLLPNDILNDTPADAAPIEENYNSIQQYLNTHVILRDGTTAMTGQLTLVGDPVSDDDAVRKGYVDTFLPVGIMLPWLGLAAPAGLWGLANGAALQVTEYQELHNVIGFRFGGSGGSFQLPNMAGVVPIGQLAGDERYGTIGNYGGSTKVPVPSHIHKMDHDHPSATTGKEPQNHQHPIPHDHGGFATGGAGSHQHQGEFTAHSAPASGGAWFARRATDSGTASFITESGEGSHQHNVNVPPYSGNSMSQNARHDHPFDVPNFVGDTQAYSLEVTDPDGKKSTTDFYAPFVVISYIVRVR